VSKIASALAKLRSSKSKDEDHEFSSNFALLQLKLCFEDLIIDINRLTKSELQQTPQAYETFLHIFKNLTEFSTVGIR
jgi:hypothetical protein